MAQTTNLNWLKNAILFAGGFALCFFLLRQCATEPQPAANGIPKSSRTVVVQIDTIWPDTAAILALYPRVPLPGKVIPVLVYDSMACRFNRVYQDSLRDSNLVFYWHDSILGRLLDKKMSYRLLIPKKILVNTTITDSIPYPIKVVQGGLYFGGELGGNLSKFNYSVEAEWVSRKKWTAGYRYGISDRTHNISFKWLILNR